MNIITALGAESISDIRIQNIIFLNNEHKSFYILMLENIKITDCYHHALFYVLGLNSITREHVKDMYDFKTMCIKIACISEHWQTGDSLKITRLAFNLFTDGVPTTHIEEYMDDEKEQFYECKKYSVSELFSCSYVLYFFQAICLRFPEYSRQEIQNAKS